jgi:inosine-uridine nucleoside N-ribohydrolase
VATGPLTNLALAVEREPRVASAVREVVLMGGAALPPGNVTPVAEFNVYADPEAAAIVFAQAWPVTMVGLDVTQHVRLTRERRAGLHGRGAAAAALVWEVTRWLFDERQVDSMALHDPLAVAVALEPDLVQTIEREVAVETRGEHTRGQTVVDFRPIARLAPNRRVCTAVDAPRFASLFLGCLGV